MRFEYLIGLRYLRARRKQRFVSLIALISLAGVMLGTFALSVDLSVMSGFEEDLHQRLLAFTPHIAVDLPASRMASASSLRQRIKALRGVEAVAPFVSGQVLLASGSTSSSGGYVKSGAIMRGVAVGAGSVLTHFASTLTPGAIAALRHSHPVQVASGGSKRTVQLPAAVLGVDLAADVNAEIGDVITVICPTGFGAAADIPRLRRFVVGGFFHSGMAQYDESMLFVNLAQAQALVGDSPQFQHGLEVRVSDIFDAPAIGARIAAMAGRGVTVTNWTQTNVGLFTGLKLETFTHFLVLLLIVLVAAFNIIATLVMVVTERRKEIAILRAMGAGASSVAGIFVFEGAMLGIIGTFLGVGSGFLASFLIGKYHLIRLPPGLFMVSALPTRLYASNFLLVALAAIVLCIAAGFYPAWQARSLSPVEVIRYE